MKRCHLTITTTIDGETHHFSTDGEMDFTPVGGDIIYKQEDATVRISLSQTGLSIERTGDYTLQILLQEGRTTVGKIGIGGANGEVKVICSRMGYSIHENGCMILSEYQLDFGEEQQRMKLRLTARG